MNCCRGITLRSQRNRAIRRAVGRDGKTVTSEASQRFSLYLEVVFRQFE